MRTIEELQAEKLIKEQEKEELQRKVTECHKAIYDMDRQIEELQHQSLKDVVKIGNYYSYTFTAHDRKASIIMLVNEADLQDDILCICCECVLIVDKETVTYDKTAQYVLSKGDLIDEPIGYLDSHKLKPATQEDMHAALSRCIDFMTTRLSTKK